MVIDRPREGFPSVRVIEVISASESVTEAISLSWTGFGPEIQRFLIWSSEVTADPTARLRFLPLEVI